MRGIRPGDVVVGVIIAVNVLIFGGLALHVLRWAASAFAWWLAGWQKPDATYPCPVCGYDIRATAHRCPECGTKLRWGMLPGPPER